MIGNTYRSRLRITDPENGGYMNAPSATSGGDAELTGPDIAGIGMQIYGASMQDKAAQEELERQQEADRLAIMLKGRSDRTAAQQFERTAAQADRGMNMQGSQMLQSMRESAMKNRRLYSTRKAFMGAM